MKKGEIGARCYVKYNQLTSYRLAIIRNGRFGSPEVLRIFERISKSIQNS